MNFLYRNTVGQRLKHQLFSHFAIYEQILYKILINVAFYDLPPQNVVSLYRELTLIFLIVWTDITSVLAGMQDVRQLMYSFVW